MASGDPRADRVTLWTRVEGLTTPLYWDVATDPLFGDLVLTGDATTFADRDWTVHVDATGLEPGTTYYYRFRAGEHVSPTGRTRTLPGPGATRLRFAMVSCAKYNAGFFNAYARIAQRDDLDFVLHLGDYIYEAAQVPPPSQTPAADIGRAVDPLHECKTVEDYRRRYGHYHCDPDVAALHLAHPIIATVDDHEFADGCWRDGSVEHRAERDGPFAARRALGWQVHWEWLPVRPPDPADPERAFQRIRIAGDLADLLLIDVRTRRDQPGPAAATMLGPQQRSWLLAELAASTATWRLLANPTPLAPTWSEALPDSTLQALATVKLIAPDGNGPDPDQWDGYVEERDTVIAALRRDSIVLAGDVHISLAMEMPGPEPTGVEFVTASLTSQNVDEKMGWPPRTKSLDIEQAYVEALPHVQWCEMDSNGYVVVDVTPDRVMAEWWHVDTVLQPSPHQTCAARWMVRHGTNRLEPAGTAD